MAHGDEIAGHVNELARSGRFDLVIATRDWHPEDHSSFEAHGGPWPVHCVQGKSGAELHPALDRAPIDLVVDKGQTAGSEGYSAFEDTNLETVLRERGIDKVTIVGLATDYCVRASALDALSAKFDVTVDPAGVRGVNVNPEDSSRALDEIRAAGATVAISPASVGS